MFRRKRNPADFAKEVSEEIRAHLELEADALKREGLSEREARRRAKVGFGNVRAAEERFYLKDRLVWLDTLAQDWKFALRQLRKNPGFAAAVVLVLAFGIGASVAIFGFVDAALLQPLPYANPNRLMSVNESDVAFPRWPLSYPDYLDWQRLNRSFRSLDVYSNAGFLLHAASGVTPVQAERVSGGFFRTLGVHPILGRDFDPGENRPNGPNVLLLSYGAWLHRFSGRRNVLGQAVDLDNKAYTVIGVLPRSFTFAPSGNAEFWVPLNTFSRHETMRGFYAFWGIGRLRDGVTIQVAQAEMTAIARQLQKQYPVTGHPLSASVVPLSEVFVGDVRPILLTLLGGACLLLLIACVNVAGLALARSERRRREIAVRGALGATLPRLLFQFGIEGLLLAMLGSVAGLVVAAGLMQLLSRLVPKDMATKMPFLSGVGLNGHTVAFAACVTLLATVLLAVAPALRGSLQSVREGFAEGERAGGSVAWRRLGANLVTVELAIAVVLLTGSGLLGKSFYRLLHVPLGFDPSHLATVDVMASGAAYTSAEEIEGFQREVLRRISSLPGVQSAGMTSMPPVECNCPTDRIQVVGRSDPDGQSDNQSEVSERHVSAAYLSTLKASLLRGRFFTDAEDASRPGVVVINASLARKYFPGQDPIGQRIANTEYGLPHVWEIVGVVNDVHESPLDADTWPTEYFPVSQTLDRSFTLAVRTSQDPGTLLPLLVSTLHQIDPGLGVSNEATMNQQIETTQAALLHRFSAWLVGGFAAMALVLAVVGLYGVIAYAVSQRTREIGVRMALGAQRRSVYALVMRQAGWLTAIGLLIGLVCSVGASLSIRTLLFGVQVWDAFTLVGVALLLTLVSMAAVFVPARRAASVNPSDALRTE